MPWDSSELLVASFPDAMAGPEGRGVGGGGESVMQPSWTPGSDLLFLSDWTGWWILYRWDGRQVLPMPFDAGAAPWDSGTRRYPTSK